MPERGYPLLEVPKVPFPRRPSGDLLRLPGQPAPARCAPPRTPSTDTGAEVVVGFGGYVSTPAYLAARRRGTPVVVHEQNARPGLANRLGARFAAGVGVTFPGTRLPHATVTGMPLRREIATLDRAAHRAEARARFGLTDAPTVLVTGGSLGAQRLNDAFAGAAAGPVGGRRPGAARRRHGQGVRRPTRVTGAPYVVLEYCDRMDLAYAAADLVVARSGANTVCELTAVGLPAVYVPLPIGNGEQRLNAAAVVAAGGGLLVDDADVTPAWVGDVVRPSPSTRPGWPTMAAAAASVGERGGDELLADLVVAAAARRPADDRPRPALRLRRTRAAAGAARPRAPHRHRRRRHVGRRAAAARARPPGQRLRRRRQPRRWQSLRDSGARVDLGHDAGARGRRRHRRRVVGRSATTTSSSPPPAPRACGCCTAPRPSPRSWAARAGSRSPAPTARPRRPRCSSSRCVAAGADPSFASGGEIAQLGTNAALGGGAGLRRRGRRERRLVPRLPPRRRRRHERRSPTTSTSTAPSRRSRRPTPPSSSPSPTAGSLVACHDDAGSRRLADAARAAGRTRAHLRPRRRAPTCGSATVSSHDLGTRSVFAARRASSACSSSRCPGDHNVMDACAAYLAAVVGLGADPDARARRARRVRAAPAAASRCAARSAGSPSSTTTPTTRPRSPRWWARHPRSSHRAGRGSLRVVFQPHLYSRTRDFADGVRPRRWRRPTRSCSSTSTAPASSRSRASRSALVGDPLRALPGRAHGARRARPATRPSRRWSTPPGPATSCSPSVPAT